MNLNEYVLHSGGAIGADQKFSEIGSEFGLTNFKHYWYKKKNPYSTEEDKITEEDYLEGVKMVYEANKILKRKNLEKYMHLLARNWSQCKYADAIYAISTLKNNKEVNGGTSWCCVFGILTNKEVFVFDQDKCKWFYWEKDGFKPYLYTPVLTKHYAGIGTREINENGINAIRNVYKKTFKICSI